MSGIRYEKVLPAYNNGTIVLNEAVYKDDNVAGISLGKTVNAPDTIAWRGGSIYVNAFDGAGVTTQQL